MNTVHTAGGIVIQDDKILLVKKPAGYVFPKGHIEPGETKEAAALREVYEETGYEAEIIGYHSAITRPSTEKTGEVVEKVICLFIMKPLRQTGHPTDEESAWLPLSEAVASLAYPAEKAFLSDYLANNYRTND